jgi:hypothetical protein
MWLMEYEHSRTNLVGTALSHSSSGHSNRVIFLWLMDQIIAETLIASITIRHQHTHQIIKKCDFWFKLIEGYLAFRAQLLTALKRPDIMGRSFGAPENIYQWHNETVILVDNSQKVKEKTFDSLIKAAYLAKKKSPNQNVQIDFEIRVSEDFDKQSLVAALGVF